MGRERERVEERYILRNDSASKILFRRSLVRYWIIFCWNMSTANEKRSQKSKEYRRLGRRVEGWPDGDVAMSSKTYMAA